MTVLLGGDADNQLCFSYSSTPRDQASPRITQTSHLSSPRAFACVLMEINVVTLITSSFAAAAASSSSCHVLCRFGVGHYFLPFSTIRSSSSYI